MTTERKVNWKNPQKKKTPEEHWTEVASKQLLGKKIVAVRYMTVAEMNTMGWDTRCIVLKLNDGNLIYPSMDDEGNGAGTLFTNNRSESIIPVLWENT